MGGVGTIAQRQTAHIAVSGAKFLRLNEGANSTVVPLVESHTHRRFDFPLAQASGVSPRPRLVVSVTVPMPVTQHLHTSYADLPLHHMTTHTILTDLSVIKPSAQDTIHSTTADIAHTKLRHRGEKVGRSKESTHLQADVTSLSPLKPAEQQMPPT